MDFTELAPAYVRAIAPYQPGKPVSEVARELGIAEADIVKLASNENPLGCGDKAKAAMLAALQDIHIYPDGNGFALKSALSKRFGIAIESIVLGNGSNDLLEYLAMAFLSRESSAIYSQHCFAVYPLATQARGATGIKVAAKHFGHDLEAMLAAIRPDTRLVFIANPNNPSGTFLPYDEIKAFMACVPREVIVVLDEAYNDFLPVALRTDTVVWLKQFANLVITRTFAKIHGLAGLRVGYMLGNAQVCDMVNRVRAPFNVNSVGQAAAIAALEDADFIARSYANNCAGMAQLVTGCDKLGLEFIPSYANFLTIRVGDGAAVFQKLLREGVIVRPVGGGYELPEHLRVTIGLPQENQRFLAALTKALHG